MDYKKLYQAWLNDERLCEEGKQELLSIANDEREKEYRFAAIAALEALKGKIPYFEVNTGAIARGYRKSPYPAPFLLDELKRLGFDAIISSDCHDAKFIDCGFDDAEQLLKAHGFNEIYVLKNGGFTATPI